ncbi:HAMP domain-containing sensor histidine kinase [Paenibacillus barengoltzii]|uniref:HAMP domain-containing sensor histidine kinase n=1 Tax=Paenibacillus barengoltzii TaxID=343517 RepID=UPI0038797F1F
MEIARVTPGPKETKLRTLFLKYLAAFCLGTIGLALLLALIFMGLLFSGAVLPADYAEKQVEDVKSRLTAGQEVRLDSPSALYQYAKYTVDGKLLEHSLSAKQSETAWKRMEGGQAKGYSFLYHYTKVTHGQEVYIFRYSLAAQFNLEPLRRLMPSAELAFFVLFCLLFLLQAVLLASSFGRKLARKMSGLQEATQRIQEQELDFAIQYSGIAEIDQVLRSMDQMRDALKNSLEQQWNLERRRRAQISALAHDVKTPLTIVRGNVELLSETEQSDEQREYTEYIAQSARQMETYIKTLIEITNTETAASYQPVNLDLKEFIHTLEAQMQALAAVKELSVEVHFVGALPDELYADPGLLERALMNVIANAMDHTPAKSKITLSLEAACDRIQFRVTDEGPGFSPEALKYATEQFYMGDPSRRSDGHYGMGLYITQFVAQLHGGELHIANSQVTGGGEVMMEVPMYP